jgi:hypothetical protein
MHLFWSTLRAKSNFCQSLLKFLFLAPFQNKFQLYKYKMPCALQIELTLLMFQKSGISVELLHLFNKVGSIIIRLLSGKVIIPKISG